MSTRKKKRLSPYRRLEEELANARCALGNAVNEFMESEKNATASFAKVAELRGELLARQETMDRMAATHQGVRGALAETLTIIDYMQKEAGWRLLPGAMAKRLEEIQKLL